MPVPWTPHLALNLCLALGCLLLSSNWTDKGSENPAGLSVLSPSGQGLSDRRPFVFPLPTLQAKGSVGQAQSLESIRHFGLLRWVTIEWMLLNVEELLRLLKNCFFGSFPKCSFSRSCVGTLKYGCLPFRILEARREGVKGVTENKLHLTENSPLSLAFFIWRLFWFITVLFRRPGKTL